MGRGLRAGRGTATGARAFVRLILAVNPLGERNTTQREAITRVIRDAAGPLEVGEIHRRARRLSRGLGIATVYRTLKLLSEAGQIHSVTLADGQPRYESADLGHHHHFHCRGCNRVFDLPDCPLPRGQAPPVPAGYTVEDHEVTLFGLCPTCGDADAGNGETDRGG